jgi:aspartate/methionine/tyrosine aminotransferase
MKFNRMAIEKESPEELGYGNLKYNLTESSVTDLKLKEIPVPWNDIVLAYTDHKGKPELRELIAQDYPGLNKDNIILTTGACLALFIINATILSPGDHILVLHPNYATNIEVPRSLGATVDLLSLKFEEKFQISMKDIEAKFTPQTKLISITSPHNPTGMIIPEKILDRIIQFAENHHVPLLVDETYREIVHSERIIPAASKSPLVISVESVSKAYGMPGVRVGWIATQNREWLERFLATKEQVCICGSIVDDEIAFQFLKKRMDYLPAIQTKYKHHFSIVKEWMEKQKELEWIQPSGGVVCFPRLKYPETVDIPRFYKILNEKFGTFVGPGHWFEMSDAFFRIGYAWPTETELRQGLAGITQAIIEAKKR